MKSSTISSIKKLKCDKIRIDTPPSKRQAPWQFLPRRTVRVLYHANHSLYWPLIKLIGEKCIIFYPISFTSCIYKLLKTLSKYKLII